MNGTASIGYHHFSSNDSIHQEVPSSLPIEGNQRLAENHLVLMISIFYIAPITVLIALILASYFKQKLNFKREINRLSQVATLERILQIRANNKVKP
jgi:hypothetical protein